MKTIFILLVIYLAYVIIKGLWAKGAFRPARSADVEEQEGPGPAHGARKDEGEEMVQDPVCLSYVPISSAVSIEARQGRVYFCSDQCRDKYMAKPGEPDE